MIRRDRRAPVMMLVHEECRITCDHRHSLWYLTDSLDCGLSRNAIRQWFVHDFIALAQCAFKLGCKPQMCGRPLQEGCNQDQTCVPHRACAPPRRNKARVKAKAQPGMAGAIAGRLGRLGVCLAYSARYPRLPVEECGGRGAAGLRGPRPNRGFELWVPER